MLNFPVFYPTQLAPGSTITTTRARSRSTDRGNDVYHGYKFVISRAGHRRPTEYYGVSGTNWDDPPILDNPSETREIDGRNYLLFYDGGRLRMVGFKTEQGAYWVTNTLDPARSTEAEMLGDRRPRMRELGAE